MKILRKFQRPWSSLALVMVCFACLTCRSGRAWEPRIETVATEAALPRIVLLSEHGRSAFAIERAGRPLFVLYAQGTLSVELSIAGGSGEETCQGVLEHHPPDGETQRYELTFTAGSPGDLLLNDATFSIPAEFTATDNPEDALRGEWFVLTSYGRAVPTGRHFTRPTADELDPERQYSLAWYMDRDIWDAEVYRNTLEMDDLEGWVVSWDNQHCIQHSDGGREARLRIWADGRVVSWEGVPHRPLVEHQISPEVVQSLVADLLEIVGTPQSIVVIDDPGVELPPEGVALTVFPRGATWNQYQEFLTIRQDGHESMIHVLYPGLDDPVGNVPAGWEEMQQRLFDLIDRSGGEAGGGEDAPE